MKDTKQAQYPLQGFLAQFSACASNDSFDLDTCLGSYQQWQFRMCLKFLTDCTLPGLERKIIVDLFDAALQADARESIKPSKCLFCSLLRA